MNGPTVATRLREMHMTLPIIGLTGNAGAEDVEYFRSCGVNAIINKPFTLEQLYAVITEMDIGSVEYGNDKVLE